MKRTLTVRMAVLLALWGLARPLILVSVALVYLLGALMAQANGGAFKVGAFAWGLLTVLLVVASTHYANEYADFETDALTTPTPFSGGSGILARGVIPRRWALTAAWVTLTLGLMLGGVGLFASLLTPAAFALLVIGAFGGWMYSLPPLKLAWRGWGELDNALLGGLILPLYGCAALGGQIDAAVIAALLPFTLFVFMNLLATTWPDRQADGQVGKYTLATRWPQRGLRALYGALLLAAVVSLLSGLLLPEAVTLSSLIALPLALWGWLSYTRRESPFAGVTAMIGLLLAQIAGWLLVVTCRVPPCA